MPCLRLNSCWLQVVGKLALHDVQTTLLVCREWHDGFANGMVSLRPRVLKLQQLAVRCASSHQATWPITSSISNV